MHIHMVGAPLRVQESCDRAWREECEASEKFRELPEAAWPAGGDGASMLLAGLWCALRDAQTDVRPGGRSGEEATCRAKFKRLSARWHPDKFMSKWACCHGTDGVTLGERAVRVSQGLNAAWNSVKLVLEQK